MLPTTNTNSIFCDGGVTAVRKRDHYFHSVLRKYNIERKRKIEERVADQTELVFCWLTVPSHVVDGCRQR